MSRPAALDGLKGWERRQLENERQAVEELGVLQQLTASMGGILTALKAPPEGDVLYAATRIIPAVGYLQKRWPIPYQAVSVANYSSTPLTVSVDGVEGTAPAQGAGIKVVPAGTFRTMALRGTALTIYGAAGTAFDLTAFARPRDEIAATLTAGTGSSTPRVVSIVSSATPAINLAITDQFEISALATPITGWTITGGVDGQPFRVRIVDNGSAQALAWGAPWASSVPALPTTTTPGSPTYVGGVWNSATATADGVGTAIA